METNNVQSATVNITVETEVNPDWIDFVTGSTVGATDVFLTSYCGYWLMGVEHDPKRGWLAWDLAGADRKFTEAECHDALQMWERGENPGSDWIVLNRDLAIKAWAEGFKKGGALWYEDGDGPVYDSAIQRALFGEAKYG